MSAADYKNPVPSKSQHALIVQQLGLKIVSGHFPENEKLLSQMSCVRSFRSVVPSLVKLYEY